MEDLLKEAFEAGKDLGHAMGTGKPTYGLHFKEWYEGKALRIHDVVGRSEQLPPNPITDKEHKDLMKALYPEDKSKRFRR